MTNILQNKIFQATLAILGVGVALGMGLDSTSLPYITGLYATNGAAQTYYVFNSNQFIGKGDASQISVGRTGEYYFKPELNINTANGFFTIMPVGNFANASFSISPTGTLNFKDDDTNIQYLYYFNRFNDTTKTSGQISDITTNNFEQEIILPSYTTSTFRFYITTTVPINQKPDGTWAFERYDEVFDGVSTTIITSTLAEISPVIFISANGQRMQASTSLEAGIDGLKYKIEVNDTWLQNATFPVRIDPSYNISSGATNANNYENWQSFVRDGNGNFWICYPEYSTNKIVVASSTDNGQNWNSETINGYRYCSIAADSSNNIHLAYASSTGSYYNPFYIKRSSSGWGTPTNINATNYSVSNLGIAVDGNDYIHYVWSQPNSDYTSYNQIHYRKYTSSWGSVTKLSANSYYYNYPSVSIDSSNNVWVFWTSDMFTGYYKIYYKIYTSSWGSEQTIGSGSSPSFQYNSENIIDSNIHLAFTSTTNSGVYPKEIVYKKYSSGWTVTTTVVSYSSGINLDNKKFITSDRSGNLYLIYEKQDSGSPYYSGIYYRKYNGSSWGSEVEIIAKNSYHHLYSAIKNNNFPSNNNTPLTGFGISYIYYGTPSILKMYLSDDFSFGSSPSPARPTSTYDANRPTSTWKAYKGGDAIRGYTVGTGMYVEFGGAATSNPFSTNRAEWGISYNGTGTEFTAAEYGYTSSTNNVYTTTSFPAFMEGGGEIWTFLNSINQFEVYATESPATIKNVSPYFIGNFSNITSTNASATNAMDSRMYMENFATGKLVQVASSLNGACTSSCVLTTTTYPWTIANKSQFFKATTTDQGLRWLYKFYVSSAEITTDCLNQSASTTLLMCMKMYETSTGPEGGLSGVGCIPQEDTEDIWSQCTTTAGSIEFGCYTDYCGAGEQTRKCGYYVDNDQHNCPQCYGCRSSDTGEDSCEAKSTWGGDVLDYGCGGGIGGECMSCNNGTCDSTLCVGYQCGCLPGQICDNSGVCQNEAPPTCNDACQGLGYSFGGCFPSSRCTALGWYVDGNSPDCYSPRICCCHN